MITKLKLFLLISYFNFLLASQLTIAPLFYSDYRTEGGTWKSEKSYSFVGGWGALVEFEQNNLSFIEASDSEYTILHLLFCYSNANTSVTYANLLPLAEMTALLHDVSLVRKCWSGSA